MYFIFQWFHATVVNLWKDISKNEREKSRKNDHKSTIFFFFLVANYYYYIMDQKHKNSITVSTDMTAKYLVMDT